MSHEEDFSGPYTLPPNLWKTIDARNLSVGWKDGVEDVGEDEVYVGRFKLIDAAHFAADQNYLTFIIQSHLLTLTVSFV